MGAGHIASVFAEDMSMTGSGRVVAIGSRNQGTADKFGDKYGVPGRYGSYEELVADPEVEVVYVATPHPWHHQNTLLALEAGKGVLVEKPFTMNADEAHELVRTARAKGLFLMEAMCTRFLPHMVEVSRLVAAGALGDVVTVTADLGYRFPKDPKSRFFARELGGGVLLDCGVYPVSLASMVLGKPEKVRGLVTPAFTGVDGQTSMLLGFSSGAHAVLTCNSFAHSPTRASIVGTEARIEIDPPFYAPSALTVIGKDGGSNRFEPRYKGTGLRFEADEVERCVRAGLVESPAMPLDETVWIMETMDAVLAEPLVGPGRTPGQS